MSAHAVTYEVKNGIATITLDRPAVRNAFDEGMIEALAQNLTRATEEKSVCAVVLRGNGDCFCAGGDLNWMKRAAAYTPEENVADALRLGRLLQLLNTLPKVTIGLVQGSVYGGGVGLAACCDILIAEEGARFCLSEVRLGLIPSIIAPYVIAAMGQRQARRYFMTSEPFDAQTAKDIGFAHVCAPKGGLDAAAEKILSDVLKGAPGAQARGKKLIQEVAGRPVDEAVVALTSERIAEARASDEGREGIAAFLEKREPSWRKK
jgi:methylglutaconyl-CoA hydratase